MTQPLDYIEVNPDQPAIASVIWLHGLGADGYDFEAIVPALKLPNNLPIHFIFPHAPKRPITLNGGLTMRAWYDIEKIDPDHPQDEISIRESEKLITALIDQEIEKGIPSEKIILAGFSQGGAIALHTGLRAKKKLGGILGLSTYLPLFDKLPIERTLINKDIPIMLTHGIEDPIIPLSYAEISRNFLESLGYRIKWLLYPMQHCVCTEEIDDISRFLQETLSRV